MSWIDWVIFTVPLLFVIGMAYHTRRYAKGVATFLSAGRVCGRYVICVADVANGLERRVYFLSQTNHPNGKLSVIC